MACPNINSNEWKELVSKIGVRQAYAEYVKNNQEIPEAANYQDTFKGVNATLKVIGALNSSRMQGVYDRFFGNNRDKFYAELLNNGATKDQVAMLKEWVSTHDGLFNPSLNDMIAGLAAEMSYTIEINESSTIGQEHIDRDEFSIGDDSYTTQHIDYDTSTYMRNGQEISEREYSNAYRNTNHNVLTPTQHYSNLTVPGGTNYRENEVRTPDIIPIRQGHAAFSTENGIGWFRSDDQMKGGRSGKFNDNIQSPDDAANAEPEDYKQDTRGGELAKTRRILEIQSDLFQKERSNEDLVKSYITTRLEHSDWLKEVGVSEEDVKESIGWDAQKEEEYKNSNAFLQLLNKGNNWVTFFTKAIIQDSVRKGYEQILFPSGNTATKVEGHGTLEDHLANTQRNIDDLSRRLEPNGLDPWLNSRIESIARAAKSNREYAQEHINDKGVALNSSTDHSISPATVDSKFNYARVRENYYNKNSRFGDQNETLTNDSYKGWVLHEYTVGQDPKITKLSDEEAQALLTKDARRKAEQANEDAAEQEANVQYLTNNRDKVQAEEREKVRREIDHLNQEKEDILAGRTQLSSIASFYENTIQNILNKQQYSPKRITDEHGNEWFQVQLKDTYKDTIYFYKQEGDASFQKRSYAYLQREGLITSKEVGGKERFIISTQGDKDAVSIQALNYQKIGEIGHDYQEKYGFNPIHVEHDGKDYVVTIDGTQVFHKDQAAIDAARETTLNLLQRLQEKTGIPFELISDDQADGLIGEEGDDNVRAFFKDGKVYMLENHLSPDIAFHEYAHPFVLALKAANPELYSKLISELMQSPEWIGLSQSLKDDYAPQHLDDEILVRAMTAVAQGETSFESPQGKSFWSKLWFGIKQLLRRVFGQNINLERLSPTTTLRDLSGMLLGEKSLALPNGEHDYTLFNRDVAHEMESIPEHEALKTIETFSRVAQDHLLKLRENGHYAELRDVLKNQADGSILNDINKLLSLSKDKEGQMDDHFKQLNNFARAVVGARILSEKMKAHVNELSTRQIDERDKLRTMRYYSFISNDWLQAFDNLRELNKQDLPLLGDEIAKASNNFRRINDLVGEAFKDGLVSTLRDQLQDLSQNVREQLAPQIESVRKEVEGGNTKLQRRLDYLQKMYDHGQFDDEKIRKLLQGELGDTNWFSSTFEAYTSSPDPIVGGFAKYFNQQLYKVESGVQEFSTKLGNDLAPLYKQYGVDISKPGQLGHQLVFKDVAFTKDENGNPKGHEVYSFLHEFGNGYQYDYQLLQHQIDEAKEGGDTTKVVQLQQQFNQLRKDYFHREYLDEVYNVKEFWNESDINRLAQTRRKEITDQLSGYEAESGFKDLTEDDREHIDMLLSQLRQLGSTKNLDGSDKTGDDLGVAQAIKQYNQNMMRYREEVPMKGAFERDMQSMIDELLDKGLDGNSPEFTKELNSWLKDNLRVRLSDAFYDSRSRITDGIAEIVKKLPQDQAKQLDVEKSWKEMFEQLKGFRDQDGQPVGTDLSEDKIRTIKSLQNQIDETNNALRRLNGLTNEEQDRYSELWGRVTAGIPLTDSESREMNDLTNRKRLLGLAPEDKARLMSLFEQLKQFQSKIPTSYYIEAMNQKIMESNMKTEATMDNIDEYLNTAAIDPFLEANPDLPFTKWFRDNHIAKVKWDQATQQSQYLYERLYIWNRIVPNDENFKNALATNDYKALLSINNPMVSIKPASKYFFYRIKNEFRTKRVVGQTTDNKGNWLPRTMEQGAKDNKYQNKQYYDLKNSRDSRENTLFRILETYKKYHLQAQEESAKYGRLWYELPRIRKERIENIENMGTDPANAGKNILEWAKSKVSWKPAVNAFDDSLVNRKNMDRNAHNMYVATDLFGNEINSVPMKYMSKLQADEVSMDVGNSVVKYAMALQINKALHDINPFAQALQQTLASEGIKDLNKTSTRNWLSRLTNIQVQSRSNVRLKTISNMIERDIEGIENKMELGMFGSKMAQHIMGLQAFGSLAMNIPAGIKNITVAKMQNHIEANSGEFFGQKNLMKADQIFAKRFLPKLVHDYNKFSNRSLETQMFELFDFVQGKFGEHVGESFSASYKKDIAKLRFTHSFQTMGEIQAQGQAGIAMLLKQQVEWRHDGLTTMIPYLDAWVLKDGVVNIKDGIDAKWGKQGNEFTAFKLRMHKINELMQGAYSKLNQGEASRYTAFKMFNFMRRYLVPGLVNRFTVNRNQVSLGTQREGYYIGALRAGLDLARTGLDSWHTYSPKERANLWKTLTEVGYSVAFLSLISMMGYSSSDPDKNKKLKDNSWAHNMALYEMVMIKGEIENFIPFPGMGVNEILRMKDQPSVAFPVINKYYKIVSHLINLIQQPFSDYDQIHYRTTSGIYKKGDLKLIADLLKLIGYTGATLHPDNAVKNYMATTGKYD